MAQIDSKIKIIPIKMFCYIFSSTIVIAFLAMVSSIEHQVFVEGTKTVSQGRFLRKKDLTAPGSETMTTHSNGAGAATVADPINERLQVEDAEFWTRDLSMSTAFSFFGTDNDDNGASCIDPRCLCNTQDSCDIVTGKCKIASTMSSYFPTCTSGQVVTGGIIVGNDGGNENDGGNDGGNDY